jgi:hypothetical protein
MRNGRGLRKQEEAPYNAGKPQQHEHPDYGGGKRVQHAGFALRVRYANRNRKKMPAPFVRCAFAGRRRGLSLLEFISALREPLLDPGDAASKRTDDEHGKQQRHSGKRAAGDCGLFAVALLHRRLALEERFF